MGLQIYKKSELIVKILKWYVNKMSKEKIEDKKSTEDKRHEKGFVEEFLVDIINLDRGLPATYLDMFRKPDVVVNSYFHDKGRYVNPLRYTIFLATVVTLITTYFIDYSELFDSMFESVSSMEDNPMLATEGGRAYFTKVKEVGVLLSTKFVALNYILILAPCISFSTFLFFKKVKPKFIEHFVLNIYYVAQLTTFSIITVPLMVYTGSFEYIIVTSITIQLCAILWIYRKYLELKGVWGYLKAIISYLVGYLIYSFASAIVMYSWAAILYFMEN